MTGVLRIACLTSFALALVACQAPIRPSPPMDVAKGAEAPSLAEPAETAPVPAAVAAPPEPPVAADIEVAPPPLRGADVFSRLTARFADPPCVKDRVVQRWEHTYGRWPPRLRSNLENILPLVAMVLDELETHHLPGEFALLPIVESWYRPDAGSPRTAYGMWQFTTATARNQGLRIVPGFDERLAPQASTRAAMRYLAILHNRFGDWKLADMAFNAGEYRLLRALGRQPRTLPHASAASHLPPGLSMTTYEHLAKMQALACLIAQPGRFGLELPNDVIVEPLQLAPLADGIESLETAAVRAGLEQASLKALNPAFLQGRIVAAAPRELLLPRAAAQRLAASTAAQPRDTARREAIVAATPSPTPREHRVRRGDTLSAIAQRYRLRLRQLLDWNRIDIRALLQPGQVLRLEP